MALARGLRAAFRGSEALQSTSRNCTEFYGRPAAAIAAVQAHTVQLDGPAHWPDVVTYRAISFPHGDLRATASGTESWYAPTASLGQQRRHISSTSTSSAAAAADWQLPPLAARATCCGTLAASNAARAARVPQIRHKCAQAQPATAAYQLNIFTGDVRGAGSPVPAEVQLIGTNGVSEPMLIGNDPDSPGFARGSHISVQLEAPSELGELRRVIVRQQKAPDSEIGVGWYLDAVEVAGPGQSSWRFPCGQWLGKSDGGDFVGERVRNLIPVDSEVENIAEYLAEPLEVVTAAMVVPHPEKVTPTTKARLYRDFGYGGEDAYYCGWGPRNAVLGLGVADGVYMWRSRGIDAGVFSRSLMLSAKNSVEYGQVDVLNVLKEAAESVEEDCIQGSSTCCLVLVDTLQGRLTSANLGDSGFLIIGSSARRKEQHIKYRSPQQEHTFGFPYQLGHQASADKADDAMLVNIPVLPGDTLVLGSDGLFDNVADHEILQLVVDANKNRKQPRPASIAQKLARAAFYNAHDRSRVTPYSLGATEAFDMVFNGGKVDDITVVIASFSGETVAGKVDGVARHGL